MSSESWIGLAGFVVGIATFVFVVGTRYWDRVALEITSVQVTGDAIFATVRNKGGTPSQGVRVKFVGGGSWIRGYSETIGPRSEVRFGSSVPVIAQEAPPAPTAIYAIAQDARRSKDFPLPATIRDSIRVSRPT